MENRYLPILHENISLSMLCVSNEPLSFGGEWVVKRVCSLIPSILPAREVAH